MIPVKLTLSNFMPYRDNVPPLNFAGIHTASICGDNGSGKSSLIDAMTWALWGKTRARSDDDLIHQGETATQVEFDFAVGEQLYRIIRKHTMPKNRRTSGQSSLDLFIANDGGFKPVSGDKIADTQKKVIDILHMDYETFINSAFLRQGHADQFTVAKPTERKTVLTSIIGLSTYDNLEQQSKELAGRKELERMQLESAIRDIDLELVNQPDYERELLEAQATLSDTEKLVSALESRLRGLRDQRELLRVKEQQMGQLDEQIARTGRDLGRWVEQAKQHRLRVAECEDVIGRRVAIEEGYARLLSARTLNDDLNQKLRMVTSLRDREHRLDLAIVQSSQALNREHALAENKIIELEAKQQALSGWRHQRQEVQVELGRLDKTDEALKISRLECQSHAADMLRLEADRARMERETVEIDEKLNLLSSQVGAKCPLCESDLTSEHLDLIKQKYAAEKRGKADDIRSIRDEVVQKKADLNRVEKEVAASEARLGRERGVLQGQAGRLDREISEAEESGKLLAEQRAKLGEIEECLARKDYAHAEQEAKRQIETQLSTIGYDGVQHEKVRQDVVDLEQYDGPKRKLDEADRLVEQEREAASQAEEAAGELKASIESAEDRRKQLAVELEVLPAVVDALSQAEDEFNEFGEQQKRARETVGRAKEKLDRCAQMKLSRQEKEARLTEAAKEEGVYRELAEAFGKKGVQALLIELALPEIESEANRLLGRMTDNRMHVKFETQRETRKGDVLETLDINIADELGTRSYEMFSGGEAFRINFAIRIALSKLLARRAGAPLPTLIVDEGFGTQDATGMEKLKEAITSVQDDFEKILVITHIEDFRDAFPARIEVVKTAEGSTIELD